MLKEHKKSTPKKISAAQSKLLLKYYPLVEKITKSIKSKLPAYADYDELYSSGVKGLIDAVLKLDSSKKGAFNGYISMRIRGAILDSLRRIDYMPRSARNEAKHIDSIRSALEQKLGRKASDDEVRTKLGVSTKQFDRILRRTQFLSFISLNNTFANESKDTPTFAESIADEKASNAFDEIDKRENDEALSKRIDSLPERQRKVINDYYFSEKKLCEIAKDYGVSEARICQIHGKAIDTLRQKFVN